MSLVINLVRIAIQVFTILVIVKVFLSYFMSPYHPVRETVDRIVNPFLEPIRKIIPPFGMIDFSPVVLILVLQLLGTILINLLVSLTR